MKEVKQMTQDEKIVFVVERALKIRDTNLLFRAAELLQQKAHFESKFNEIMSS